MKKVAPKARKTPEAKPPTKAALKKEYRALLQQKKVADNTCADIAVSLESTQNLLALVSATLDDVDVIIAEAASLNIPLFSKDCVKALRNLHKATAAKEAELSTLETKANREFDELEQAVANHAVHTQRPPTKCPHCGGVPKHALEPSTFTF